MSKLSKSSTQTSYNSLSSNEVEASDTEITSKCPKKYPSNDVSPQTSSNQSIPYTSIPSIPNSTFTSNSAPTTAPNTTFSSVKKKEKEKEEDYSTAFKDSLPPTSYKNTYKNTYTTVPTTGYNALGDTLPTSSSSSSNLPYMPPQPSNQSSPLTTMTKDEQLESDHSLAVRIQATEMKSAGVGEVGVKVGTGYSNSYRVSLVLNNNRLS